MFGEETYGWGRGWNPWQELNRLQGEVNRLFSGALESRVVGYPRLRVRTNEDEAVIQAELPGIKASDIEISVLGDSVTLSGTRQLSATEGATFHRREREHGQFTRALQVPFRIEADKVLAEFKNGILELHLPRAAADKPKKISLKVD